MQPKLSDESEWGSMLALALVQVSQVDMPAAIKSAELAADLTVRNNQHLCIEVAQQIKKISYDFGAPTTKVRSCYLFAATLPNLRTF